MKIVFAVSEMGAGGAERVVSSLANEMVKYDHSITILMVAHNKKESFYKLDENINLVPLLVGTNNRKCRFFKRVKLLKEYFFKNEPDIVISFLPHVCVYTYFALKNTNIPFILSERNDPHQYNIFYKVLLRKAFNKANGCVFQTHDAMKWYRHNKVKSTDRIIFNPVNLTYTPKIGESLVRKKNVLFVGRIDPQKNYNLLLHSFALFAKRNPEYVLDIYGDGPDKEKMFKLIKKLNLTDKVIYHGKSTNWQEQEYNSGVFVSTSLFEGMPNSLIEAASLGIPCVATDCHIGGSKEIAPYFANNFLLVNSKSSYKEFSFAIEKIIKIKSSFNGVPNQFNIKFLITEWQKLFDSHFKNVN